MPHAAGLLIAKERLSKPRLLRQPRIHLTALSWQSVSAVRARFEIGSVNLSNRVRIRGHQTCRPQRMIQIVAAVFQLGGQATIENQEPLCGYESLDASFLLHSDALGRTPGCLATTKRLPEYIAIYQSRPMLNARCT